MKIAAIFGSPHLTGFSSSLHEIFLSPAEEKGISIARIPAYTSIINPCIDCGLCRDESRCYFDDGMNSIYKQLRDSDGITISSPVYFSSLPGPLKNLIDRCQLFWEEQRRNQSPGGHKKAFFLATAGSSYSNVFSPSLTTVRHLFNTLNCSFNEKEFYLLPGVDDLDEVPESSRQAVLEAGKKFVDYLTGSAV
ncbi:MAG TPA: flavodoxin family protein [Spirochaetota bacterium]|nr:flavodoxin family protein [Spirochaetota bacterium]HPI89730.1 flavodoxin family protein [Spirochaetota bacterium]HPR46637.1 flavodoxin family protein [Spirochaetota bacterium]